MLLDEYIIAKNLKADIIEHKKSVKTVSEAIAALKCKPEDIIKSIVVLCKDKYKISTFYLILLQGNRKIKTKKIKDILGIKDVALASPEEVENITGYNIGDIPPISLTIPVIIDEIALNKNIFFGGGGKSNRNLKISLDELLDCTHPLIADISIPL
ncbi:aminoacyl-tRNA deacylase [Candidatus Hodarchaeum mangrovi]